MRFDLGESGDSRVRNGIGTRDPSSFDHEFPKLQSHGLQLLSDKLAHQMPDHGLKMQSDQFSHRLPSHELQDCGSSYQLVAKDNQEQAHIGSDKMHVGGDKVQKQEQRQVHVHADNGKRSTHG